MKRQYYSLHYVHSLAHRRLLLVRSEPHAHLIAWADTEPSVVSYEMTGPQWEFVHGGRKRVAEVPMTVYDRDGVVHYWDGVDDRRAKPSTTAFLQERCDALKQSFRLFDSAFLAANLIEHKNRVFAHRLLVNARDFDSGELEEALLLQLDGVGEDHSESLARHIGTSTTRVLVAALRLWKRDLVRLPIAKQLISDRWTVSGGHHAA